MTDLTNRINKALEDVVSERNLPVVLTAKDIAVTTQNVVDITKDVITKLQAPVTATEEQPQEEPQK
jgi:Skp family chaperone for outer membrane proteins